ncbi:MAG: AraC family transcriptional regulator [Alphaproteobacteria bacterium]|nr:AraC family transcriptional regulator [Alphaproteobacteria bacterium]
MNGLSFSLLEVLFLIGVVQCVYVAVHIAFRFAQLRHALLPFLYFVLLGLAFLADFGVERLSLSVDGVGGTYFYIHWALWFSVPPLSVLLVFQIAEKSRKPDHPGNVWVMGLVPLGMALAGIVAARAEPGCSLMTPCRILYDMLGVTGLMSGAISLLVIFSRQDLLKNLYRQKSGQTRYWLIFAIISLNTLFLAIMLGGLIGRLGSSEVLAMRGVLGLGFVYLAGTGFFRIYPYETKSGLSPSASDNPPLDEVEQALAQRIEGLLNLEKVYQEPTYSRADLAHECGVPESAISRVINAHFGKTFPRLINERRVEDAKRLLLETDAPVQLICSEVGFNSLASFNRSFREITDDSPGQFRKRTRGGG